MAKKYARNCIFKNAALFDERWKATLAYIKDAALSPKEVRRQERSDTGKLENISKQVAWFSGLEKEALIELGKILNGNNSWKKRSTFWRRDFEMWV